MTNHYKVHKPEPIDMILKYNLNFVEGNIVKYILRSPFKGDSRGDLKKALEYARIIDPSTISVRFPQFDFEKELQEYKELDLIKKTIIALIINGLKGESDKEILIDYLEMAIGDEKESNKQIHFRRHPLSTLLDLVEMDGIEFLETMDCTQYEEKYLSLYLNLRDMIEGDEDFIEFLEKIGHGSKEFWKNRYKLFSEQKKMSVPNDFKIPDMPKDFKSKFIKR